MVRKNGNIILVDSSFQKLNYKYGIISTGGAATIARDTNHVEGGPGAVKITTGAVNGNTTIFQKNVPFIQEGQRIAFECKFIPDPQFATNKLEMGIVCHLPSEGILEGKVIYDQNTKTIKYQTGASTFTAFTPPLDVPQPRADAAVGLAGDRYGWIRITIDLVKMEFVSVEASGRRKNAFRDLRGKPMINIGAATINTLICMVGATNAGAAATTTYTTDWAIASL